MPAVVCPRCQTRIEFPAQVEGKLDTCMDCGAFVYLLGPPSPDPPAPPVADRRPRPRAALAAACVLAVFGAAHLSRPTGLASITAAIGLCGLAVRAGRHRRAPLD